MKLTSQKLEACGYRMVKIS